jgi:CheY-like chemotaxis protein
MEKNAVDLLIVEDEAETRSWLAQIFATRGYRVRSASDGFAALAMIRDSAPAVILSDLNMPGMSGFELLSVVRRLYPSIYVVASSGAYSGTQVPEGIAADGFHEKATGIQPLLKVLHAAAEWEPANSRAQRVPTPIWVNLEEGTPDEGSHVLIHCPACLRPFRQNVEKLSAEVRNAGCRHCGSRVEYAIALAEKPVPSGEVYHSNA